MEFELPESVAVATKVGDRLVLERSVGEEKSYVTVDFEWRRWQLGAHPHRMLNFVPTSFKGRNWKKDLVRDAINALLAMSFPEESREGSTEVGSSALALDPSELARIPESARDHTLAGPAEEHGQPVSEGMIAFAWKRLQDGQISQDITAASPEALFVQAGFRPHRVLDPIQGFQCVRVRREKVRWVEA